MGTRHTCNEIGDDRLVDGSPGARRVEIDDVQSARAVFDVARRELDRIPVARRLGEVALDEAYGPALVEVDRRNALHRARSVLCRAVAQRGEACEEREPFVGGLLGMELRAVTRTGFDDGDDFAPVITGRDD